MFRETLSCCSFLIVSILPFLMYCCVSGLLPEMICYPLHGLTETNYSTSLPSYFKSKISLRGVSVLYFSSRMDGCQGQVVLLLFVQV